MLAVITATALWGANGTVAGYLFDTGVQPLELVAARTVITFIGLACLVPALARPHPLQPGRRWPLLIAFGLAVALANAGLFLAIDHLPVAVAMVLQSLAPAFVVGWLVLLGRRHLSTRFAIGLAGSLIGVALVVKLPTTPLHQINLVGIGFGIATAVAVAAFSMLGNTATRAYGALRANAYAFAVSSVAWLLFLLPQGVPKIIALHDQYPGIAFVSVMGTLAPFVLFSWGTARVGAQAGAVNISLEPVFSAVLAWIWLGQTLDQMQIAGGVLLITAVVYLQRHSVETPRRPTRPLTASSDMGGAAPWRPSNHGGDLAAAKALFAAAATAGPSAVRLQKRDNRGLFTKEMPDKPDGGRNRYGATYGTHREALEFGESEYRELAATAAELGIDFLTTTFDEASLDFIVRLGLPAIKIASGDLTNSPLLEAAGRTGIPVIVSSGGANLSDVVTAVGVLDGVGARFALLQCTATYPAQAEQLNLQVIDTYRRLFPSTAPGRRTTTSSHGWRGF